MDIEKFHEVLTLLDVAGIKQVNLIKRDNDVHIYAADDVDEESVSPSIVVVSEYDNDVIDISMGISNVSVILKRLNLFDIDKVTQKNESSDKFMKDIRFRQGRKSVSYRLSNPEVINVPSGSVDEHSYIFDTTFTKDFINSLVKANSAMSSPLLKLTSINNNVVLDLNDNNNDNYSEVVDDSYKGKQWNYSWKTVSVLRLLKHCIKSQETVNIKVGESGILYITINEIRFMLLTQLT